LPENLTF